MSQPGDESEREENDAQGGRHECGVMTAFPDRFGRQILGSRDAIILMPQQPLVAGQTYTVSITSNGTTYTWSFTASSGVERQPGYDAIILPTHQE